MNNYGETVHFPYARGDRVTLHGDPGWAIVGLCASDRGLTFLVEKGLQARTAHEGEVAREESVEKERVSI